MWSVAEVCNHKKYICCIVPTVPRHEKMQVDKSKAVNKCINSHIIVTLRKFHPKIINTQ